MKLELNRSTSSLQKRYGAIFSLAACALCYCATAAFGQINGPLEAPAASPARSAPYLNLFSSASGAVPPAPWRVVGLPKGNKPLTHFDITPLDGHAVLRIQTDRSYANLVHDLPDFALAPGMQLRWRWRLTSRCVRRTCGIGRGTTARSRSARCLICRSSSSASSNATCCAWRAR